jgi:hypothetical protein
MTTREGLWSDKAKAYLQNQSNDLEKKIHILKRKRKFVKVAFVISITISLCCSTVCASLGGFLVPTVVITVLSTCGALSTALSMRFKLKRKQNELNNNIDKLEKTKRKLDYVVACNGDFSKEEFKKIIGELS